MPRLLFRYLFKRIGFGVLVVQLAFSVPVVLSYLLYQLPPAAVRGGLVIPALDRGDADGRICHAADGGGRRDGARIRRAWRARA